MLLTMRIKSEWNICCGLRASRRSWMTLLGTFSNKRQEYRIPRTVCSPWKALNLKRIFVSLYGGIGYQIHRVRAKTKEHRVSMPGWSDTSSKWRRSSMKLRSQSEDEGVTLRAPCHYFSSVSPLPVYPKVNLALYLEPRDKISDPVVIKIIFPTGSLRPRTSLTRAASSAALSAEAPYRSTNFSIEFAVKKKVRKGDLNWIFPNP